MSAVVRDVDASVRFYQDTLGFRVVAGFPGAAFLQASGSSNDHDLGLFGIGEEAPPPGNGDRVGLYHLAWEVAALTDLAECREELGRIGALTGESDHGNSLSIYATDPDGNEFEVFWMVPRDEWETRGFGTRRLDLEGELERRGLAGAGR